MELAALLYLGEYIHARHLWRRHRGAAAMPKAIQSALQDWWNLGRALMEHKPNEIWARLNHLKQNQPKPYCDYAQEVGDAVCRRWIPKLATLWNKQPRDAVVLGLPRQEWVAFLEKHRKSLAEESKNAASTPQRDTSITDTISFLESPALRV